MLKCSNCGQKAAITKDWACRWCGYPFISKVISKAYAKEKARQEAIEAKEKAKQEAIETKRAKEAGERAKKEAEEVPRDVQDIVSEIYEGDVQLVVQSLVNFNQLRQFQEDLKRVDNLKIVWVGGSDKGTVIAVSLQKPMTLIRILNYMATVGKVDKKGEKIVVMLRNSTTS